MTEWLQKIEKYVNFWLTRENTSDKITIVRWANEKFVNIESVERCRSGHNEAVLKTVCPKGRVGSNPTLSASFKQSWRNTQEAEGAPLERE